MTQRMIITRGLPASGKSTWATKYILENQNFVRVERDLLRDQLFGNRYYSKPVDWNMSDEEFKAYLSMRENTVTKVQTAMVISAFAAGKSVVISDTNLRAQHVRAWAKLAASKGAEVEIKEFNVDLDTLISRDKARADIATHLSVGESVIRKMWNDSTHKGKIRPVDLSKELSGSPSVEPYDNPNDLPKAIIVDIDGTLAKMGNRSPYEWHRVGEDSPVDSVIDAVHAASMFNRKVIIMSGRDSSCREETVKWLNKNLGISWHKLFMRAEGDNRKDDLVKYELFNQNIRDKYHVRYILDDRDQVVAMWRKLGLACFQVNYGDF